MLVDLGNTPEGKYKSHVWKTHKWLNECRDLTYELLGLATFNQREFYSADAQVCVASNALWRVLPEKIFFAKTKISKEVCVTRDKAEKEAQLKAKTLASWQMQYVLYVRGVQLENISLIVKINLQTKPKRCCLRQRLRSVRHDRGFIFALILLFCRASSSRSSPISSAPRSTTLGHLSRSWLRRCWSTVVKGASSTPTGTRSWCIFAEMWARGFDWRWPRTTKRYSDLADCVQFLTTGTRKVLFLVWLAKLVPCISQQYLFPAVSFQLRRYSCQLGQVC